MASTRNKNTPGNYASEKSAIQRQYQERMYIHQTQGQAANTQLPGNGLLSGRYAGRDLAKNDCDIESFLFGIGSTNLEVNLPHVNPERNDLQCLNIIERIPMRMPRSLTIEPNQRIMYLN